jgi:hypothetical protein
MNGKDPFIARCIFCICCFPVLIMFALFLIIYSPFYGLLSLLVHSRKKTELKQIIKSQLSTPSLTRLQVKHV